MDNFTWLINSLWPCRLACVYLLKSATRYVVTNASVGSWRLEGSDTTGCTALKSPFQFDRLRIS